MEATAIVLSDSVDQESHRIALEVENWGKLRFRIILKAQSSHVVVGGTAGSCWFWFWFWFVLLCFVFVNPNSGSSTVLRVPWH